jgi:hypothetical protein
MRIQLYRSWTLGPLPERVILRFSKRIKRVFEKLTLPLRSRAHLRDYGSHEHPMLRHRSQRRRLGLDRPVPARLPGCPAGWAATHDRPARPRQSFNKLLHKCPVGIGVCDLRFGLG